MGHYYIPGYDPTWLRSRAEMEEVHGGRLTSLVGRRLTKTWLLWGEGKTTWFGDGPVILDFEGRQVEICHREFDKVAITWGGVDVREPLERSCFALTWRSKGPRRLERLVGRTLLDVALLEWEPSDPQYGDIAIHFVFDGGRLTIYNLADSTAMTFRPLTRMPGSVV